MAMENGESVTIYKATKILQAKVGTGVVNKDKINACQAALDLNRTEFQPMARKFLEQLDTAIQSAHANRDDLEKLKESVTRPVMQLKANAAMFGYPLVGDLAHIMLSFLESVTSLDKDMLAIIEAHHKTLSAIIAKKMKGDGGPAGVTMKAELMNACKRYIEKRVKKTG